MASSKIKPGWVKIYATQPPVSVLCRLGSETPQITGGYGGWSMVDRPRRVAATVWEGREPRQMNLPVILDGFKSGESVVSGIVALEKMALPTAGIEPPRVTIEGPGIMHTELTWVINNIDWGDALFDDEIQGMRTRQAAVLTLIAYVGADRLATGGAAAQAKRLASSMPGGDPGGTAGTWIYTVKASDVKGGLAGIAARELGKASRSGEIKKMNGIRDPKNIKKDQKLKMPPRKK